MCWFHEFDLDPARLALMPNAAPEWQAGGLWGKSSQLLEACPLEGLVRPWPRGLDTPLSAEHGMIGV
jgi:hypothetical protein